MGLADKLIQRLEEQAETLAEYRQRDEKHRGRIYDLEGQLARLTSTCDAMRQDITTLREENETLHKRCLAYRVVVDGIQRHVTDVTDWSNADECVMAMGQIRKYLGEEYLGKVGE